MTRNDHANRPQLAAALFLCATLSVAGLAPAIAADAPAPGEVGIDMAAHMPDIAAGEEKSKACNACHGERGISQQDNYPHLHGQRKTYLLRQMRNFRDKVDRRDPIMTPMLEAMTDQDLVNLAAYYSGLGGILGSSTPSENGHAEAMPTPAAAKAPEPATAAEAEAETTTPAAPSAVAAAPAPAPAPQAGDASAGKTKSAACAACHGMDGRGTTPLFPNLNGQQAEYLAHQLKLFRDGKRQDATMAPMALSLTDQDIADLAAFYATMN